MHYRILFVLCCLPLSMSAQKKGAKGLRPGACSDCPCMIERGTQYYDDGQYAMAINEFTAAQTCNRGKSKEANIKITETFIKVDELRNKAVDAEKKAQIATKKADIERNKADIERNKAVISQRIAETSLEKAKREQLINEWSAYAAGQSEGNANHAWYLGESGCKASHYTNLMAILQRTQLWSDYNKLYYKKSFFHPLNSPVKAMAVSPNERFILAGFADGSAKIWTIKTGQLYFEYPKFSQPIQAVAISDSGTVAIVTNSVDRTNPSDTLFIYPSNGNNQTLTLGTAINCVSLSKDGQRLVVGTLGYDAHALLLDLANVDKRLKLETHFSLADHLIPLKGHINEVVSASFSPTQNYVATASGDKTAVVYDFNGKVIFHLKGHAAFLRSVAFSNDGLFIATASDDKTIRLWDAKNGQYISPFTGHTHAISSVTFIPNSEYLVSFADKEVFVWNRNGQKINQLKGHNDPITSVAASSYADNFFTGDESGVIRHWVIGNVIKKIDKKAHNGPIEALAFSKDGHFIATGAVDKTIKLWTKEGKLIRTFEGHFGNIKSLDFSQDGRYLLSGSRDNVARLWRVGGLPAGILQGHQGSVYQALFMPDGQHIVSGSSDSTVRIWTYDGKEQAKLFDKRYASRISSVAYSADGLTVYSGGDNGIVVIWKKKNDNWRVVDTLHYAFQFSSSLKINVSKNGQYLAITGGKGVDIRDLKSSKQYAFEMAAYSADWGPLSNLLTIAGDGYYNYVWDVKKQALTHSFVHLYITNTLFSPDGQYILTANRNGNTQLTQLDGTVKMVYGNNETPIQHIFCNEQNGSFVTVDAHEVVFWDSTGTFLGKWQGEYKKNILSAAYAKASNDLWVLQTGGILTRIDAHKRQLIETRQINRQLTDSPSNSIALSPNGQKLLRGLDNNQFTIIELASQNEIATIEGKVMGWVNNDVLYVVDKASFSLIPFMSNSAAKRKNFILPDIRPLSVAVSTDGQTAVVGEQEDGCLYLFQVSKGERHIDSIRTGIGIEKITFIDKEIFLTYLKNGKIQLHALIVDDSSHLRMTPALQTMDKSSGIWAYNTQNYQLIVAENNYFTVYPLANIGQKPTEIDSLWWHEKIAYNLPIDEFNAVASYKKNPAAYQQEFISLAMMKRLKSTQDAYFKKSVNLIAAIRYAKSGGDNEFSQMLQTELDLIEVKLLEVTYESNSIFHGCLKDFDQYRNDAIELDSLNKHDPDPLYRAESADRYSSAAYMSILTGFPAEALNLVHKAKTMDKTKTWVATNLALAYLYMGKRDSAFKIYSEFKHQLWKNSGYPRVTTTETATFKDKFLEDIDSIKSYIEQDPKAFSHLKEVDLVAVSVFLKKEEDVLTQALIVESKSVPTNTEVDFQEPKTMSIMDKRVLTDAEKKLLKQLRNEKNHSKAFKESVDFILNLEKEVIWDTTNVELRFAVAEAYFLKAWHGIFLKKFRESELSAMRSIFLNATQPSFYLILGHTQFFQDKFTAAQNNYSMYLDRATKAAEEIQSDVTLFKQAGIAHKDFSKIERLIENRKSPKTPNR